MIVIARIHYKPLPNATAEMIQMYQEKLSTVPGGCGRYENDSSPAVSGRECPQLNTYQRTTSATYAELLVLDPRILTLPLEVVGYPAFSAC